VAGCGVLHALKRVLHAHAQALGVAVLLGELGDRVERRRQARQRTGDGGLAESGDQRRGGVGGVHRAGRHGLDDDGDVGDVAHGLRVLLAEDEVEPARRRRACGSPCSGLGTR
jgi:hypothetical protein